MEIRKKCAALHNLGCKVNAYETEAIQELLEKDGYTIVPFSEPADVYVINTCSVTNIADRKSRQMIHRAKKKNPDAIVVAAGCYVQTEERQEQLSEYVDIILGNNKKTELIELLHDYEEEHLLRDVRIDINHGRQIYEEMRLSRTSEHTRAFLKVQDGCNQFCSYCIIPYARGRVRSRQADDVCDEVERLVKNGCQEIVLTGIHLSSYGVDTGSSLLELLERVHGISGVKRIRMGSLEPGIITEEFVRKISSMEKICPHFHLSLQSGCDETLKRMNRRYTTAEYAQKCSLLRKYYGHPAITTDIIVGFPGETEEEFAETLAFAEQIRFYEIHVFKYSKRQGTKAAQMEDQIAEPVKHERSVRLIEAAERMKEEFCRYYDKKQVTVLYEESCQAADMPEVAGQKYYQGYTPEYVKVVRSDETDLSNKLCKGTVQWKEGVLLQ